MATIIIDAVILIISIIVALLPTDNETLYWVCWFGVFAWSAFLAWDIYEYRRDRWCR